MKLMKLVTLALVAVFVMVGCESKTEAPAEAIEQTVTEATEATEVTEDAEFDTAEDEEEAETLVETDENETVE
ncbi:MAG: hypothetical protein IBX43_07290 [Campylobacterales bacterium]|nr:hypothetical protein [Campylobacterales bacterium]